ncbi:MAG: proteasome assembly chaperone family protein [Acidimicrobiales bacterium]
MPYYEIKDHEFLDGPVLVVATEGWIDAGYAAATAASTLANQDNDQAAATKLVAVFDDETFLDRRARRPTLHITDGVSEPPRWPSTHMVASKDLKGQDVCYLVGPEPDFHWRSFVDSVLSICNEFGVRMAVGLGAFPAPVPHTRPVRLAATASSRYADLAKKIGVVRGTIEVPSGIWGPLEHALPDIGIPAIGLWARVPHYVATMPYPSASLSLVNGLCDLTGLSLPSGELMSAADSSLSRINEIMGRSVEHSKMVKELEESIDNSEGNPLDIGQMPTGDEIATELERYLSIGHLLDADDAATAGGGGESMPSGKRSARGQTPTPSAGTFSRTGRTGRTGKATKGRLRPESWHAKGEGGIDEGEGEGDVGTGDDGEIEDREDTLERSGGQSGEFGLSKDDAFSWEDEEDWDEDDEDEEDWDEDEEDEEEGEDGDD